MGDLSIGLGGFPPGIGIFPPSQTPSDTIANVTDVAEDDTATRILDAAVKLFAESGYGSTTVDEIARRAGVGVATLYRRWDDKPALANAVYAAALADMTPLYDDFESSRPKQQFLELWHRVWDHAHANPEAFTFVEGHVHAAFVDDANLARKAALLVTALVMGPIVSLLRAGSSQDPNTVGERVWNALRT